MKIWLGFKLKLPKANIYFDVYKDDDGTPVTAGKIQSAEPLDTTDATGGEKTNVKK